MERIIFRKEKNPYTNEPSYLAVFPDDETNPGRVECLPFCIRDNGTAVFEPLCEADLWYYYKTKIVHKNDPLADKLLKTVSEYYEGLQFRIVEKLTY